MSSSFLTRTILSRNQKVALLERQLSRRKKASCSMAHYLSDKFKAAESLRRIGREISEDEVKELIFAGLPAEQYANFIRETQGHSLMVIGCKLVKYEKEIVSPRRKSDRKMRKMSRGIAIMALVLLSLFFRLGANPADGLFEPLQSHADCICQGSGPGKVCSCIPFQFLMFESAVIAGFTIALLMVLRMTKDFELRGWIWTPLALYAIAFLLSIYVATPWMFRWTMMIIGLVTVVSICLLLMLVIPDSP